MKLNKKTNPYNHEIETNERFTKKWKIQKTEFFCNLAKEELKKIKLNTKYSIIYELKKHLIKKSKDEKLQIEFIKYIINSYEESILSNILIAILTHDKNNEDMNKEISNIIIYFEENPKEIIKDVLKNKNNLSTETVD